MRHPLSLLSARSARVLPLAPATLTPAMAPGRAAADSLVYVAGGHVHVANADGSQGRARVTYKRLRHARHTFAVEAIDGKGKIDGTPATARFKV